MKVELVNGSSQHKIVLCIFFTFATTSIIVGILWVSLNVCNRLNNNFKDVNDYETLRPAIYEDESLELPHVYINYNETGKDILIVESLDGQERVAVLLGSYEGAIQYKQMPKDVNYKIDKDILYKLYPNLKPNPGLRSHF